MKLAIGNDHVAIDMKKEIRAYLEGKGIEVVDVGTDSPERFNYPISGYKVARLVADGEVDGGVLICGTGVGISLAANKVRGIRACVCSEPYTARLSKQHNNANIIAFGARVIGIETAKMIVDEWLAAEYEGGRHQTRVDMIAEITGYKPEEMAFVGDRLYTDVRTGVDNGCKGFLVLTGEADIQTVAESDVVPTCIYDSLNEMRKYL